jgi:hypothetical protein
MPLFEIETHSHIVIAYAQDEEGARGVLYEYYPSEETIRITKRPRDAWLSRSRLLESIRRTTPK